MQHLDLFRILEKAFKTGVKHATKHLTQLAVFTTRMKLERLNWAYKSVLQHVKIQSNRPPETKICSSKIKKQIENKALINR
jgi:hypothetical protein